MPVTELPSLPDMERPTTITPVRETAIPASSLDGRPSRSSQPPSRAIRTGPMPISIAAVPASTSFSPQFRATM